MNQEFKNLLDEIMSLPLQERPKIYAKVNTIPASFLAVNLQEKLKMLKSQDQLHLALPIPKTVNLVSGMKGYQKKDVNAMDKSKAVNLNIPNYELNIIKDLYGDLWSDLGSSFCIRLLLKIAVDTINEKNNVK